MATKYKFVPDLDITLDPNFLGIVWESAEYDGVPYMDGGMFSIKVDENLRSLSEHKQRQGVFVKLD